MIKQKIFTVLLIRILHLQKKPEMLLQFDGFTLIDQSKTICMVLLLYPEHSFYDNQITNKNKIDRYIKNVTNYYKLQNRNAGYKNLNWNKNGTKVILNLIVKVMMQMI